MGLESFPVSALKSKESGWRRKTWYTVLTMVVLVFVLHVCLFVFQDTRKFL